MLTRDHLFTMIQFIDTMASRGAIRGDELSTAGVLREAVVNVINQIDAASAEQSAPMPELLTEED